jgi:glycine betaine/choline ABC-type transport system substrate-binding protein
MKKKNVVLIVGLVCSLLFSIPGHPCVGRVLIVAINNPMDQVVMGQMLATLINERTGTTVNIVQAGDLERSHETLIKGEANIYIDYIDTAWTSTGHVSKIDDPQKAYTLVSQFYLDTYAMVWLKPFGYEGPLTSEGSNNKGHTSLAAPVTTKDVLKKFPVLDRVINKLAGRIDNDTMEELRKKAEKEPVEEVVREFLKSEKLI